MPTMALFLSFLSVDDLLLAPGDSHPLIIPHFKISWCCFCGNWTRESYIFFTSCGYSDSNSNTCLSLARDSLFFNFSVLFTRQRYKGLGLIKQRDGCIYFHRGTEEWDYLAHRYPLTICYCVNPVGSTNERQT